MSRLHEFLTDVRTLFVKDVLELRRKPSLLVGLIAAPIAVLLLFGFVFPNVQVPTDVPFGIAVADDPEHGGSEAPEFVAKLLAVNAMTSAFDFTVYDSEAEARGGVERRDVYGFILVPDGFTDARRHGGYAAPVLVYYDQGNPTLGRMVAGQAELLIHQVARAEGMDNVKTATHLGSDEAVAALIQPYDPETRSLTAAPSNYFQFLVPGLILLATMNGVILGLPNAMGREKGWGTLDAILCSPVTRSGFLCGKLAAAGARALVQATLTVGAGVLFFNVSLGGQLHLVVFLAVLSLVSFSGFALALGTFLTPTRDSARGLRLAIVLPMMFLSGIFFPVEQLPPFLQPVSAVLPLTYAVSAMRRVVITGAGLDNIAFEVGLLAVIAVVGYAIAIPLVKRYTASV